MSTPNNTFSRQHAPQCRPVAKIGSHKFKSKLRKIVAFDHLKRTLLCPHLHKNEICQRHNYEVTQNKKDVSMKLSFFRQNYETSPVTMENARISNLIMRVS